MEVVIIGAGGFCKQVIEVFEMTGVKILGLLDDRREEPLLGYRILGRLTDWTKTDKPLFCAVGSVKARQKIYQLFPPNWINCIHPSANISKYAKMGVGNYIGPGATIMQDVEIGNNNILDPLCLLSHDVILGNHNHLAGHSSILGRVRIGDANLIGSNSTILPELTVGSGNILGAGAVVTRPIDDDAVWIGLPAQKTRPT